MSIPRLLIIFVALASGAAAFAQTRPRTGPPTSTVESGNSGRIRGRVVLPGGTEVSQAIKISLGHARGAQTTIFTDQQGSFDFGGLTPGAYTLEAEGDRQRYEVTVERVEVYRGGTHVVTIYLKEKSAAATTGPNGRVVTAGELDTNVPGAARKEFERASKAAAGGKIEEAVALLRKAVAVYPDYMMAHNDLGTHLLSLGRLEEAAQSLQRAAALDPKAFNPQLNLGIVLVYQRKFSEASAVLNKALSADGSSAAARLYAGIAYEGLGETAKAERELTTAYHTGGAKFALALFYLGQLYMKEGKRESALQSLEAYLREAPAAPNAEQARRLLALLR